VTNQTTASGARRGNSYLRKVQSREILNRNQMPLKLLSHLNADQMKQYSSPKLRHRGSSKSRADKFGILDLRKTVKKHQHQHLKGSNKSRQLKDSTTNTS
jgi:hypothetical protein